jgi:hypothetical protein
MEFITRGKTFRSVAFSKALCIAAILIRYLVTRYGE